jgi:hypothetical protein
VRNIAAEHCQEAAFVTKATNDNKVQRPLLEIGFKDPVSDEEITKLSDHFANAGLRGFSLAKDKRGRSVGVRTQSIPEFGGISDKGEIRVAHAEWERNADQLVKSLDRSNISHATRRYADTKIYSKGKDY